ncbi:NFATC2-interacting protein isoform X1 [Salvelinus sp. IW2-2015]|uniref:NFATC2-interacting protein isoform X1 n=1 Tax=Salvelinus sp. IW2-2015 TaxID=2691554 RepID=UPI000CDFC811|nr:NFATC2-interacting protein isoform X1 [Salvelinus alpinus]
MLMLSSNQASRPQPAVIEPIKLDMLSEMNTDSDSDLELTAPVKPQPKRRRIIDPSSITTVPIYSNKVNSSLQLNPTLFACDVNAGDNAEEVSLWAKSPPSKKKKPIIIALNDSEDESEPEDKDLVDIRTPSPPPPPGSPFVKVSNRANRKILEINRKLKAVGSLLSPEAKGRSGCHSPPLTEYDDDDIILMSPNSRPRSQPLAPSRDHSPLTSREIALKFRSRTDLYKIPVLTTVPLSKAVEQLSVKLKVPPSRILLLRRDIELPVHSTANELGLGIADIIDCVVIAADDKHQPEHGDMLTVRLQAKEKGSAQEYSLHKDAPLGSILSQYVSSMSVDARRKVRFQFDGSKVVHSQTPSQLDMEDGDVIEVWV